MNVQLALVGLERGKTRRHRCANYADCCTNALYQVAWKEVHEPMSHVFCSSSIRDATLPTFIIEVYDSA